LAFRCRGRTAVLLCRTRIRIGNRWYVQGARRGGAHAVDQQSQGDEPRNKQYRREHHYRRDSSGQRRISNRQRPVRFLLLPCTAVYWLLQPLPKPKQRADQDVHRAGRSSQPLHGQHDQLLHQWHRVQHENGAVPSLVQRPHVRRHLPDGAECLYGRTSGQTRTTSSVRRASRRRFHS
jgi:hypothetical protein